MLKLFLLLLFSFFAADIHSKESYCPNSIHVEALLSTNFELDQRGLAKKCIDGFEKIYGDPWLYFEDLNIEQIGRAHVRTPVTSLSRMPSSA